MLYRNTSNIVKKKTKNFKGELLNISKKIFLVIGLNLKTESWAYPLEVSLDWAGGDQLL